MELHLKIVGYLLMGLSFLHFALPKYFNWKEELRGLTQMNRQLMYVHSFFIALIVFLIGWLCVTSSSELIETTLGRRLALGLVVFWSIRLFIQFFGYSSEIWKGKTFETIIHILASAFWLYLSVLFFLVYRA